MGSAPKVPKPQDPLALAGGQSKQLLGYYGSQVPEWLKLQGDLGPQIMGQMFDQTNQFLGGVNGQEGYQGLQLSAGQQAGKTLEQLRAEQFGQMTGQSGLARGLMQAMSPEQAAAVQGFATEAQRANAAAQGVTPEEQRMYQQTAREAASASGRLGDNSAIASEIMKREDLMAQKRAEAANASNRSYQAAQGFYTQPGLNLLGQAPLSYAAGQQALGTALTSGPASSGNFDYNDPLNYANQRASAIDKQKMAQFQADQQHKAQVMGGISQIAGLALAPFTGGLSAGLGLSGLAGGAAGATGLGGMGLSAGMGLSNLFGGIPKATPVY